MTEKELENKLKAAFQTLEIYKLYDDYFKEKFGRARMREMINIELDKIIAIKKELKKFKSNNDEK